MLQIEEYFSIAMPFIVGIGIIILLSFIIVGISKAIGRKISRLSSKETNHMKLETSYDFYYIVSRLGEDPKRDEIIVHSKGRNYPDCVLHIQKHNLGMRMYIKNSKGEITFQEEKVTVNEAALKFQEFWEKPIKSQKPKSAKSRKKPPLVFK